MKLNHINLTVTDAREAGQFLEKYFDLHPPEGVKMSPKFAVLNDEQGMVLTLIQSDEAIRYPSSFHIGFIQPSHDAVNAVNQRLQDDGYDVPPPSRQHGSWTFYFEAPGGFTVEVLG